MEFLYWNVIAVHGLEPVVQMQWISTVLQKKGHSVKPMYSHIPRG